MAQPDVVEMPVASATSGTDELVNMKQLIVELEVDYSKLYTHNVKAAAPKLRAKLQQIKVLAQKMREDALNYQKNIQSVRGGRTVTELQEDVIETVPQPSAVVPVIVRQLPEMKMYARQPEPSVRGDGTSGRGRGRGARKM